MSLDNFKQVYVNTYQEIFQKVLVGLKIANMRFQSGLKFGESVTRTKVDISGVQVRDITILTDRTIDDISDSEELLTINYNKGTTFRLSTKEMIQAGPLNPAMYVGGKVAHKTATVVDADILFETTNAFADFDNGDLTTTLSTGTPITLNSTTVPQMVSRMPAKLRSNNQILTDMVFVTDSYGASDITQYLMGKQIDNSLSVFKNGYSGQISSGAEMYISENLTGEAVLGLATQPTANDTVTINGLVYTFVASPAVEGDVDLGADVDATRANLAAAINGGAGAGTAYIAWTTTAKVNAFANLAAVATNDNTANTLTIVARGSGRLAVSETLTVGGDTFTKNFIHSYFGKKGAIDVVMQEEVDMEMRDETKQRTTNIFSESLYGILAFEDGRQQFLDVHIAA